MGQQTQNLYEGIYIIKTTLSDDARNKALEKIKVGITGRGGEIKELHDWGRKRLAYEIDGHRDGHYYVVYFTSDPASISEMWKEYHLMEDLVRFFTMRTDTVKEKLVFKSLEEIH